VFAYIQSRISNSNDAEVLMNEVFIRAWQQLGIEALTRPVGWLMRTATNLVADYFRTRDAEASLPFSTITALERRGGPAQPDQSRSNSWYADQAAKQQKVGFILDH